MNTKEKVVDSKDLDLKKWLELMQLRSKNVLFESYHFPTDQIRDEFIANIFSYPKAIIKNILESFLIPSGLLGSDKISINYFVNTLRREPTEIKKLLQVPYYKRVFTFLASRGKIPIWEGITWSLDLLPFSPRKALDAIDAYLDAHIASLPDGRIHGLSDAIAIIRARYFNSSDEVSISILSSLKPTEFEHLVESIYYEMGYITSMTKPSHDGGRDIIATKEEPSQKQKNLIQCKKWQDVVGVEIARSLYGIISHEKATKGTLVTTSHFSPDASKFAVESSRLELIDKKALLRLLNEHLGFFWISHTDYLIQESKKRHPLDKRG